MPAITDLPALIAGLPDDLRRTWNALYSMRTATGRLVPPAPMTPWIERQFGELAAVRHQQIVAVTNRWTLEGAMFNPLRARRPSGATAGDGELAAWMAQELEHDLFAAPLRDTPADAFGRIKGEYCMTASNIAKYDGWHGLVIPAIADPLDFTRAHMRDFVDVALRWIDAAHAHDQAAIYPLITWNCLPKSGATIVHSHWQIALGAGMHYARVEMWRRAAELYDAQTGHAFVGDLARIHGALGLTFACVRPVLGMAHITPMRNRELLLLLDAPASQERTALADALFTALRALIDSIGVRAFNMAIALPPLSATPEVWAGMPTLIRIADRGAPLTLRSDWGAMELYGTSVVTEDPFAVAAALQQAMPLIESGER